MNKVKKSISGDEYFIVASKGTHCVVEFVSSGYQCRVKKSLEAQGKVFDPAKILKEYASWDDYDRWFVSNDGQKFHAFKKKGKKVKIFFPDTKYLTEVFIDNAIKGKVKDPLAISVYGEGSIGIIDKTIPYWKPAKQLWQNMMKRCYSEKDARGYYGKTFVDDRWKVFENFLNDIKYLEGFSGWKNSSESGISFNLDKDFYVRGNELYSRHFCCFLPEQLNKALGKKDKTKTDWA